MASDKLQIIPLGGLGEFGMNCLALRFGDDIIVIDAGLMFPEEELLGVDIVVPDISYLIENRAHVRGIVLTHGHEDHIGGLPWILSELNVPVHGTEFTLAYVEGKLDEHRLLDDAGLIEMLPGRRFSLGAFSIMPIRVTHSLVDCVALAIHTPAGIVLHTGDFKIDLSSPDGHPFDLQAFADLGKQNVLCLLHDSTNVDRAGFTPGERAVRPRLDDIFGAARKKIFFSCFSSSIHRIRIAMELADETHRKVALIGRSIDNSAEIAQDLGYLDPPQGLLIHPGQIKEYNNKELCILISGTQGEPMSSLSRAAVDNHKFAKIDSGDTVILSSRIIPGNEKAIYRVIDHLERRDARVIHDDGTNGPHSRLRPWIAGRAADDDQSRSSKFFVPIHGDYRHLKRHAELAAATGIPEKVLLLEDGDVLELDRDGAEKVGKITTGRVCIDNNSTADVVEDTVIRDRKHLGGDGLFLPIIAINKRTGQVEGLPEISRADLPPTIRN